jgi:CHAT domain-containing protein
MRLVGIFLPVFLVSILFQTCTDKPSSEQELPVEIVKVPDSVLLRRADSLFALAEHFNSIHRKDTALLFHQKSLEIKEAISPSDTSLVKNYLKVAGLYLEQFKYDVADQYLEKARLIESNSRLRPEVTVELLFQSVRCKENLQDFTTAHSILLKVSQLIIQYFPKDNSKISRKYFFMGANLYYQGKYHEGSDNYRKALQYTAPEQHREMGRIYLSLAMSLQEEQEINEALRYFKKAVEEGSIWAGPISEPIASVYTQMSGTFARLNMMDSALFYLRKNLHLRKKIHGEKNKYTFGAKYSLGQFFFEGANYDSALQYYQDGLVSLIDDFQSEQINANPKPDYTELNADLINCLVGKANSLEKLGSQESIHPELLDLSLATYRLADSVFNAFRDKATFDDQQLNQLELNYVPYDKVVSIALRLFELRKESKYSDLALQAMERSRAVLLRKSLNKAETYNSAGIKTSYRDRENSLARQYASILQQLSNKDLADKSVDSLNNELLKVSNDRSRLRQEIRHNNPNYFVINFDNKKLSVTDVQGFLKVENSVLLEYLWGEHYIYALAISGRSIKTKSIELTPAISRAMSAYLDEFRNDPERALRKEYFNSFCSNSFLLQQNLVGELLDESTQDSRLIISADGPLATFPFDALITQIPDTTEINYNLPYLMKNHSISYAYSSEILLHQSAVPRDGKKIIAFGYAGNDSANNVRSAMANLPGTREEIKAIEMIMENSVNQYWLEGDASENLFKQQASHFDIVHLALHGEADTTNALNSRLVFRTNADSLEDGSLYAHELYDMDLSQLDLAVLSACETGVGKQQTGEGVMSIARGFAYAGCPSLVVSLWKIDDRVSAKIMSQFYKYVKEGQSLDYALTRAKADYILNASEFNSHPFYWAAFMQVGNAQKLDIKKPNWWGWVLGMIVTTLSVIWVIKIRREARV